MTKLPPNGVLFACTFNAIRSPMAEGLMKHYYGKSCYIDSVGVYEGGQIDPFVIEVMHEIGIDLNRHHSKTFKDLEDLSFDLIITLSPQAQHQAAEITRTIDCVVEYWPTFTPDHSEGSRDKQLEAYRQLRNFISNQIIKRFGPPLRTEKSKQFFDHG